jgi:tRNA G18 (ribose-2'-O)-methylase SpoU
MSRGFFGIGVWHVKSEVNVGTLMRSATAFGADFAFTVGRRYRPCSADTPNTPRNLPVYHYGDVEDLVRHLPYGCPLVGVEIDERAVPLNAFEHPERACYLLGAEDHGLSKEAMARCHRLVSIPGASRCLNVASAGTVVLYDRISKGL